MRDSLLGPEVPHLLITFHNIETNRVVQLAQTHGAKEVWAGVALVEVVAAVHEALEEDAVAETEHVSDLVTHRLAGSDQDGRNRVTENGIR